MPAPGSDFAVVRFLTTGACDKYFKATENGIEIQGDKKTVVFVEKQPGPASVNDVMEHCAAGDASRCVRALDAEEDMSEVMLMKLARGKGTTKREVDRIKQGKTTRGVSISSQRLVVALLLISASATTLSFDSQTSIMHSTSSVSSMRTMIGSTARSATRLTLVRRLRAFTTRTRTSSVLSYSSRVKRG
jgi:hypothetical protein